MLDLWKVRGNDSWDHSLQIRLAQLIASSTATPAESYPLYSSRFSPLIKTSTAGRGPTYPTIPHIVLVVLSVDQVLLHNLPWQRADSRPKLAARVDAGVDCCVYAVSNNSSEFPAAGIEELIADH